MHDKLNTEEPFEKNHILLKDEQYMLAMEGVLNFETGRIRNPYSVDLNHSWYIIGDIYFKLEDYTQSLRAFKSSLRNRSDDDEVMLAIANCYSELRNPKLTKYYLLKAIEAVGEDCEKLSVLKYNLGNAYFDMSKYEQAIKAYKGVGLFGNNEASEFAKININKCMQKLKA